MTLQNIPFAVYPRMLFGNWFGTTGYALTASGHKVGQVIAVPKTGSITGVSIKLGTVTTTGDIDVQLQSVGTDGLPTGTVLSSCTVTQTVTATTDNNKWLNLTFDGAASHSATAGDIIAIVVKWNATASVLITAANQSDPDHNMGTAAMNFYHDAAGSGYGSAIARAMFGALNYSGTYYETPGLFPGKTGTAVFSTKNISTNDQQVGLKFRVRSTCRALGVAFGHHAQPGNRKFNLWDTDGATVLASINVDIDWFNDFEMGWIPFTSAPTLTPGWYRVCATPTAATLVSVYTYSVDSNAIREAFGVDAYYTESTTHPPTQESHWTDTDTDVANIAIVLDQIDDGAGGGNANLLHGKIG